MITNEIDKFRNDFFEKVLAQEKEKEMAQKLAKTNCPHLYNMIGQTFYNGKDTYQERTCSKCYHSDIRAIRVWEGTKLGKCIVM